MFNFADEWTNLTAFSWPQVQKLKKKSSVAGICSCECGVSQANPVSDWSAKIDLIGPALEERRKLLNEIMCCCCCCWPCRWTRPAQGPRMASQVTPCVPWASTLRYATCSIASGYVGTDDGFQRYGGLRDARDALETTKNTAMIMTELGSTTPAPTKTTPRGPMDRDRVSIRAGLMLSNLCPIRIQD